MPGRRPRRLALPFLAHPPSTKLRQDERTSAFSSQALNGQSRQLPTLDAVMARLKAYGHLVVRIVQGDAAVAGQKKLEVPPVDPARSEYLSSHRPNSSVRSPSRILPGCLREQITLLDAKSIGRVRAPDGVVPNDVLGAKVAGSGFLVRSSAPRRQLHPEVPPERRPWRSGQNAAASTRARPRRPREILAPAATSIIVQTIGFTQGGVNEFQHP